MPDIQRIDKKGEHAENSSYSWDSVAESIGQRRSSRFGDLDFIIDEQIGAIYRETYTRGSITSRGLKYFVVTPGYEYRPDLLSLEIYGTDRYWHYILEMNNLTGFEDFRRGMTIVIPAREAVENGI